MKALKIRQPFGLEHIETVNLPDPGQPKANEIRVKIYASSMNYHDLAVILGMMKSEDGRIPLSDGAGIVEAIGEGVTEFKVGDHVVSTFFPTWQNGDATLGDFRTTPGDGVDGYAVEYVVRPTTAFTLAPKDYTHAEAATLTTAGLTAWRALVVNGHLKAGDTVLVLGTGGVSIFALQLAKAMGAMVIATSSSDEKLEQVKKLGADFTINYKKSPDWAAKVLEYTHGRGVDHTIEVGGASTLAQSIQATRIGGHIALIGVLAGVQGEVPTRMLMGKQQRLQGLVVGSRQHQIDLVNALNVLRIKPIIQHSFPMTELKQACELQMAGAHFGKISLVI